MKLDPDRLQSFALAYAPNILAAVEKMGPWHGRSTAEEYALEVSLAMMGALERGGVAAIEHYYLNRSALQLTCTDLGITVKTLDIYLEGK